MTPPDDSETPRATPKTTALITSFTSGMTTEDKAIAALKLAKKLERELAETKEQWRLSSMCREMKAENAVLRADRGKWREVAEGLIEGMDFIGRQQVVDKARYDWDGGPAGYASMSIAEVADYAANSAKKAREALAAFREAGEKVE